MTQRLVSLNKYDVKRKLCLEKLGFPFTLIKNNHDSNFVIKQDHLNTRLCIFSDKPYDIIYEDQIIKMFLKEEY